MKTGNIIPKKMPIASYAKDANPCVVSGYDQQPYIFTARVSFGAFQATATGTTGKAAYTRLVLFVGEAAKMGNGGADADTVLEWLRDGSGAPPSDRYIRASDARGNERRLEDSKVGDQVRNLHICHNEALYRAGAELCLQNGGDPDQLVWWHNGEHSEPWGDAAQASMDDAARVVCAFLSGGDYVLVNAKRHDGLLSLEGGGDRGCFQSSSQTLQPE